jgi:hypothetical protein
LQPQQFGFVSLVSPPGREGELLGKGTLTMSEITQPAVRNLKRSDEEAFLTARQKPAARPESLP